METRTVAAAQEAKMKSASMRAFTCRLPEVKQEPRECVNLEEQPAVRVKQDPECYLTLDPTLPHTAVMEDDVVLGQPEVITGLEGDPEGDLVEAGQVKMEAKVDPELVWAKDKVKKEPEFVFVAEPAFAGQDGQVGGGSRAAAATTSIKKLRMDHNCGTPTAPPEELDCHLASAVTGEDCRQAAEDLDCQAASQGLQDCQEQPDCEMSVLRVDGSGQECGGDGEELRECVDQKEQPALKVKQDPEHYLTLDPTLEHAAMMEDDVVLGQPEVITGLEGGPEGDLVEATEAEVKVEVKVDPEQVWAEDEVVSAPASPQQKVKDKREFVFVAEPPSAKQPKQVGGGSRAAAATTSIKKLRMDHNCVASLRHFRTQRCGGSQTKGTKPEITPVLRHFRIEKCSASPATANTAPVTTLRQLRTEEVKRQGSKRDGGSDSKENYSSGDNIDLPYTIAKFVKRKGAASPIEISSLRHFRSAEVRSGGSRSGGSRSGGCQTKGNPAQCNNPDDSCCTSLRYYRADDLKCKGDSKSDGVSETRDQTEQGGSSSSSSSSSGVLQGSKGTNMEDSSPSPASTVIVYHHSSTISRRTQPLFVDPPSPEPAERPSTPKASSATSLPQPREEPPAKLINTVPCRPNRSQPLFVEAPSEEQPSSSDNPLGGMSMKSLIDKSSIASVIMRKGRRWDKIT